MGFTLLKKIWPYLLLVVLGLVLYGGFRYFTNKVEELTQQNTILQAQNAEVNNNYTTLQNMYSISMKQVEDLQKQQKESLEYVTELRIALNEIDLEKIKSFAGLFNLTTNKKIHQNAIDYNSINSPEDLHFFYITTIQNGKKLI